MRAPRALLGLSVLALVSACTMVSGLSGLTFGASGGTGGVGGSSASGPDSSSASSGTGGLGGASTAATGGGGAVASMAASGTATATSSSATGSSSGSGGGDCIGSDPGVCCPTADCTGGTKCCLDLMQIDCSLQCNFGKVTCDDSADCTAGNICCSHFNGTEFDEDIKCQPSCAHPAMPGQYGSYEICSTANPTCLTGGSCHPASHLPGDYGYCF